MRASDDEQGINRLWPKEGWFFQRGRVHLHVWAVAGHKLGTLSICTSQEFQLLIRFANYKLVTNFVNIRWYLNMSYRWLHKYTTHWQFMTVHELWNSIIFLNFKTSLVIALPHPPTTLLICKRPYDALSTKIDMLFIPKIFPL